MKSFLKKSVALIIFAIIFCGFSYFHVVKAATVPQAIAPTLPTPTPLEQTVPAPTQLNSLQTGSQPNSPSIINTDDRYSIFNVFFHPVDTAAHLVQDATFTLFEKVLTLILTIVNLVLAAAAYLFDTAITFSLFQLHDLFTNSASVINDLWALIRDTANIFFIFMLLYIAIGTIIGSAGMKSKTTITNVVVSALFINFSMFIARVLIDFGNIIAVTLYNQIPGGAGGLSGGSGVLSGKILENLGLETLFSVSNFSATATSHANFIMGIIMSIVLVCVLAYVYFYAAFIFIGRAAMLIFLVIASPIGFVGSTIPGLKEEASEWWKNLTHQILVAPVFMLFMVIIIKIMSSNVLKNSIDIANGKNIVNIAGIFYYIVVMKLLFVALKKTKELSGEVGEIAIKAFKGAATVAAIAATSGAAAAGGLGALGASALESGAARAIAGRVGLEGARSRLALTGKNIAGAVTGTVGKFVSGDIEKQSGYIAKGLSVARGALNAGIKTGTAGTVDISGLQKTLKKAQEDNEKKIMQAAEAVGPQKARDTKDQLEKTRENIKIQAETRIANETADQGKRLEEQHAANKKAQTDIETKGTPEQKATAQANVTASEAAIEKFKKEQNREKEHEANQEALKKSKEDLKAAEESRNPAKFTEAKKANDIAQANVTASEAAIKNFEEVQKTKQKETEEKIAKEMGIIGTTLADGTVSYIKTIEESVEKAGKDIIEGTAKRNKYIADAAAKGEITGREFFGILKGKKGRGEIVAKMRAQQGKYKAGPDKEKLRKDMEELFGLKEEKGGGTGEKTTKNEPKENTGTPRTPGGGVN